MFSDRLDSWFRRSRLARRCEAAVLDWDGAAPQPVPASAWRFLSGIAFRHFRFNIICLMLLSVCGQLIEVALPWVLGRLVSALSQGVSSAPPAVAMEQAGLWLLLLVGGWYASQVFVRAYEVLDIYTSPGLRMISQKMLLAHLLGHSARFFHENFAGKLGQKVKQVGQSCVSLVSILCTDGIRVTVTLVAGSTLLVLHDPFYGMAMLVWTVFFFAVSAWFSRRCMAMSTAFAEVVSTATGRLVDTVSNVDLVRSFARAGHERGIVGAALNTELREAQRFRWFLSWNKLVQALLTLAVLVLLVVLVYRDVVAGRTDIGGFVTVYTLVTLMANSVQALANRFMELFEQAGVITESVALISRGHDIVDAPGARPLEPGAGGVVFRDVRFAYPDGTPVFDSFNLTIAAGEKVGIVGRSGSGKSTLIRLLRRDHEVSAGVVLVDGQDVRGVTLTSLREAIAEVPQNPGLFHRPVGTNIGYGDLLADQAAIRIAATRAGAHDFIAGREQGYETVVGEQGLRLSGGERQRVAVARALVKTARILILDEATSALDTETEALVQEALEEVTQGRTVIAIAHRLSTLLFMDRIVVLDHGKVVEQGTHEALLAQAGHYARLWSLQSGGARPRPGAFLSAD